MARPTVIYNSGYDSTFEEAYFAVGAAALIRGYNALAFDGPGRGAALRVQALVFRPDWEKAVSPVVDFALDGHFDIGARWGLQNGCWARGARSYADLFRKTKDYSLAGVAQRVTAPTLILDAEHDQFFKGQPPLVKRALTQAATTLITLTGLARVHRGSQICRGGREPGIGKLTLTCGYGGVRLWGLTLAPGFGSALWVSCVVRGFDESAG